MTPTLFLSVCQYVSSIAEDNDNMCPFNDYREAEDAYLKHQARVHKRDALTLDQLWTCKLDAFRLKKGIKKLRSRRRAI